MLKIIGNRVATIRKLRNMSQSDLEAASGKMINTISNLERGCGDVKITTLHEISHALKVPLAELVVDNSPIVTDSKSKIYVETVCSLRKLTSDDMEIVCSVVKAIEKRRRKLGG